MTFTQTWNNRTYYYPCDRETYHKIRRLRYLWFKTIQRFAAWERWARKLPHNRIQRQTLRKDGKPIGRREVYVDGKPVYIPEPRVPEFMLETLWNRKKVGHAWVEEMYRAAKHPQSEAPPIFSEVDLQRAMKLLEQLEEWYA